MATTAKVAFSYNFNYYSWPLNLSPINEYENTSNNIIIFPLHGPKGFPLGLNEQNK